MYMCFVYMCVCVCVFVFAGVRAYARAVINFSRSQDAHARGHSRHASALGETLRLDPRSFLSPRFSVPRRPRVAQARTAFRISEGRATRTREGVTARGSVAVEGGSTEGQYCGSGKDGVPGGKSKSQGGGPCPTLERRIDPRHTTGYTGTARLPPGYTPAPQHRRGK